MRIPKLSLFLLLLALLYAARALQCGASLADVVSFEFFALLWIVLPGCSAYARWRDPQEDGIAFFGMACATGYALQALGYACFKLLGIPGAFAFWPVLGLPWIVRLVRAPRSTIALPSWNQLALLLLVLAFALERCEIDPSSAWFTRAVVDPLFHLGNTVELRLHWPMSDPRIATQPLNYHFLGYAAAAGANQVLGTSLAEFVLRTGALLAPLFFVLQVWNVARALFGRASAGFVAALLIVIGTNLASAVGLASESLGQLLNASRSLDTALTISKTSPAGLMLFASLVPLVRRELARGGALVPGCLLALALAGLKGSIAPVLLAGLALDALVRWLRRDESRVRALRQLVVFGAASAVFVVWLTLGQGSYAGSIFRFAPLFAELNSGMWLGCVRQFGWERHPGVDLRAVLLLLPWIALALGPSIAGALVAQVRGGRAFLLEHLWLWGTLVAGLTLALAFGSPGHNELAFLHPGQVALALLAAGVFTSWEPRLWLCAAPFVLGALVRTGENLARERRLLATPEENAPERRAMQWIRENTPPDALIVLDSPSLYVSAIAERRAFHESTAYTPAAYEMHWVHGDGGWTLLPPSLAPDIDKRHLRERLVAGEPGAREELRAALPNAAALYLLFEFGKVPDERTLVPHAERVFRNEAFELWRERE